MKTNRILSVALLVGAALALAGCSLNQQIPKTDLSINPVTHEVKLSNPKNTVITKFSATVDTNGTSTVSFDSLSTVMDETNVVNTGNAEAAIVTATGTVIQQALTAGGAAAGAAMGAAAKAP